MFLGHERTQHAPSIDPSPTAPLPEEAPRYSQASPVATGHDLKMSMLHCAGRPHTAHIRPLFIAPYEDEHGITWPL